MEVIAKKILNDHLHIKDSLTLFRTNTVLKITLLHSIVRLSKVEISYLVYYMMVLEDMFI